MNQWNIECSQFKNNQIKSISCLSCIVKRTNRKLIEAFEYFTKMIGANTTVFSWLIFQILFCDLPVMYFLYTYIKLKYYFFLLIIFFFKCKSQVKISKTERSKKIILKIHIYFKANFNEPLLFADINLFTCNCDFITLYFNLLFLLILNFCCYVCAF